MKLYRIGRHSHLRNVKTKEQIFLLKSERRLECASHSTLVRYVGYDELTEVFVLGHDRCGRVVTQLVLLMISEHVAILSETKIPSDVLSVLDFKSHIRRPRL